MGLPPGRAEALIIAGLHPEMLNWMPFLALAAGDIQQSSQSVVFFRQKKPFSVNGKTWCVCSTLYRQANGHENKTGQADFLKNARSFVKKTLYNQ